MELLLISLFIKIYNIQVVDIFVRSILKSKTKISFKAYLLSYKRFKFASVEARKR